MEVYINSITGIDDAICSMFVSRGTLTRELENEVRRICNAVNDEYGRHYRLDDIESNNKWIGTLLKDAKADDEQYNKWLKMLCTWGQKHITMLRFIDISCTVYGLHRAGQDDWDAHACRFNNRIIRTSSRIKNIKDETKLQNMSSYYADKVLTTDAVLNLLNMELPETIKVDGKEYVRAFNGYIVKGSEDNQDVKRGLYNLGFPSDFVFKVNLTEFAHVYKERNINGGANPEVKQCCELICNELMRFQPMFDRELLRNIQN